MRTTIYINRQYFEKLKSATDFLNISKSDIISILLSRMSNKIVFKVKTYETVHYQESDPDINWITMHVRFNPLIYEKTQDMKRNYKFSVSWLVSYAIINYLDEIMKEITDNENNNVDNYDQNFIHIVKMYGGIRGFITLWGVPEEKYLNKLLY